MAYAFNGSNQYITAATSPVANIKFSIAARFRKTGAAVKNGVFFKASTSPGGNLVGFYFGSANSVRGYLQGTSLADWAASGGYTTGQWGAACLTCESSTLRTIYRDGANSVTNTAVATLGTLNNMEIAAAYGAATFDGEMAEIGVWSDVLTAEEVAAHAAGYRCDKIRPQSLVFYAPLLRNLQDIRGGLALTNNNGATVANHPRRYG